MSMGAGRPTTAAPAAWAKSRLSICVLAGLVAAGCATAPDPVDPAAPATSAPGSVKSLTWLGTATLSRTATGLLQHFGGISGMDRDPATDIWYLLSDDRSQNAPARFYTTRIAIDASGFAGITVQDVVALKQADGSTYPDPKQGGGVPDPEALRIDPRNGELVWSSEGDRRLGLNPWVRRASRGGALLGEWNLPKNLAIHKDQELGSRNNLSLEGLAFAPDGASLWLAMEAPLYEDGPVPTPEHGAVARFTRVARNGEVLAQYAYPVDAVPVAGTGGHRRSDNGVSEILAIGDGSLLVIERSGHEVGELLFEFSVRVFEAKIGRATHVAGIASLSGATYTPMSKRLILDLNQAGLGRIDNIEAAAWGPRLPDGRATLVLASDDNFAPNQVNQFIVFAVEERQP